MSTDLARVPRKGRMPRTQPSGELSHEDKAAVLFKSQMCKFIKNGGVCPYGEFFLFIYSKGLKIKKKKTQKGVYRKYSFFLLSFLTQHFPFL